MVVPRDRRGGGLSRGGSSHMSWVSNLTIGRRLGAAFGVILVLTLVLGVQSVRSLRSIDAAYSHQLDVTGAQLGAVGQMRGDFGNEVAAALRFQITENPVDADAFRAASAEVAKDIATVTGTTQTPEGRARMATISDQHTALAAIYERTIRLRTAGRHRAAEQIILTSAPQARKALNESIDGFITLRDKLNATKSAELTASANRTVMMAVGLLVACLAIGVGLALVITRSIVRPLNSLRELAGAAAEGDLTVTADARGRDEIASVSGSFNTMLGAMRTAVASVLEQARMVGATATEIANGSDMAGGAVTEIAATVEGVAKGSSEQARSTSDVTQTVREMAHGVQQVAEGGQRAAAASGDADSAAADGSARVGEATDAMRSIERSVDEAAAVVAGLGEKSEKIGEIVSAITQIADQTNLLALNAAIEAARAGEHGRGFAVVADEVRQLAEEAQSAAGSIEQIIRDIQHETGRAVSAMDDGRRQVTDGVSKVRDAGAAFDAIRSRVGQVVGEVGQVAAAAQQLEAGALEVDSAVSSVAAVSEQNAAAAQEVAASTSETSASVEELAASAAVLADQAQALNRAVEIFRV